MESMTAPTGRRVYFLSDPIEDNIKDWADYKNNYEALIAAQLFYPRNNHYEVIPWPQRVYEVKYKLNPDSEEEDYIARPYSTEIGVIYHVLQNMPLSDKQVSGSNGLSVVMANSIMFQGMARPVPTKPSLQTNVSEFIDMDRTFEAMTETNDPQISNFFGLVNPFIKRGVPVHFVHMENMGYPDTWKDVKVLLMSYANQKPMEESQHSNIADWVKDGGTLVYVSRDNDPFQGVPEWWNQGENHYDKSRYPELSGDEEIHLHANRNYVRNNLSVNARHRVGQIEDYVMENNSEIDSDRPLEYFLRPEVLKEYGLEPVPYKEMGLKANKFKDNINIQ
jgi:hypothetical protein